MAKLVLVLIFLIEKYLTVTGLARKHGFGILEILSVVTAFVILLVAGSPETTFLFISAEKSLLE